MGRVLAQKRHRRLVRDDLIIRGVEDLKAEAILLKAKVDDLGEVAGVDIAPGVPLARERVGESRRKSLIISGLDDDADPKRVDVGACAGSERPSDLFAHELGKAVA